MEAIDVTVPAPPEELERWQEQVGEEQSKQRELLGRAEAMRQKIKELAVEGRKLEQEREASLIEGRSVAAVRSKIRENAARRQELTVEAAQLEEAAGSAWDLRIKQARVKAAQARMAQITGEAEEAVRTLAGQLPALIGTVERIEALRREHSGLRGVVSRVEGARGGGRGLPGVQWSHRAWAGLVKALDATRGIKIDVPE